MEFPNVCRFGLKTLYILSAVWVATTAFLIARGTGGWIVLFSGADTAGNRTIKLMFLTLLFVLMIYGLAEYDKHEERLRAGGSERKALKMRLSQILSICGICVFLLSVR
jgi:hypothetical protein